MERLIAVFLIASLGAACGPAQNVGGVMTNPGPSADDVVTRSPITVCQPNWFGANNQTEWSPGAFPTGRPGYVVNPNAFQTVCFPVYPRVP